MKNKIQLQSFYIVFFFIFCCSCSLVKQDKAEVLDLLKLFSAQSEPQATQVFYIVSEYDCDLCIGQIPDWAENYSMEETKQIGIYFRSPSKESRFDSTELLSKELISWNITTDIQLYELLGKNYPEVKAPYVIEIFQSKIVSVRTLQ